MRSLWLTDIHLNFLNRTGLGKFCRTLRAESPDALFITGDIGDAPSVANHLVTLTTESRVPIYFVLGNHDFYHGSLSEVRSEMQALTQSYPWLHWLPAAGVMELTSSVGLLGHDSWADGRYGDYQGSSVELNDFQLIKELRFAGKLERLWLMQRLAEEAAVFTEDQLEIAGSQFQKLIYLTHVPPFRESCWHQGGISGEDWLPFFSCQAVGEALLRYAHSHPAVEITVFCGHTHSSGTAEILPNLIVHTGEAEYGSPQIQRVIEIT